MTDNERRDAAYQAWERAHRDISEWPDSFSMAGGGTVPPPGSLSPENTDTVSVFFSSKKSYRKLPNAGWHARDAEVRRLEEEAEKQKLTADLLRTELQTVVGVVSVFGPPELLQRVRSMLTKRSE